MLSRHSTAQTPASAHGLIDNYLSLDAMHLIRTGAASGEMLYCPDAITAVAEEMRRPGIAAERIGLPVAKPKATKRFGLF